MNRKGLAVGLILLLVGTSIIPTTAQNTKKPSQQHQEEIGCMSVGVDQGIIQEFRMLLIMQVMVTPFLSIVEPTQRLAFI